VKAVTFAELYVLWTLKSMKRDLYPIALVVLNA
jgi:hypothetical protein